jgi:hypothetical protein
MANSDGNGQELSRKYRKMRRLSHTRSNGRPPGTKNKEGHSAGAPRGNVNNFKHGLTMIASSRKQKRLPRGKDKRFKLELLNELIQDAGGPNEITATRRLHAEIIATDAVFLAQMDRAIQRVFRTNPHYLGGKALRRSDDRCHKPRGGQFGWQASSGVGPWSAPTTSLGDRSNEGLPYS